MKEKALFALICAGAIATSASAKTRYTVTELGFGFGPQGINGACMLAGEGPPGFAWDPVNGLTLVPGFDGADSWPYDVNESGTVCGYAYHADGSQSAILWDRVNGTRPLPGLPSSSYAYGINNLGDVVGRYVTNLSNAFIWKPGQGWTTLYDPGVSAVAFQVNIFDQVLGTMTLAQNQYPVAVIWQPDGSLTYLGNLPGTYDNRPTRINDLGYVCGGGTGYSGSPGYLWNPNGTYTPIYNPLDQSATLYPEGLNNHNVVCGYLAGSNDDFGFVWTQDSGVTILDGVLTPEFINWHIANATAVNDYGQIGADVFAEGSGVEEAALLSPIPENVVIADSYSLYRGTLAGGVLFCLQFQDALYLDVHPGKTITAAEPPVQVRVSGYSPTASPKSFQFTFTGHVNTPQLTEGILLYNFQAGAYELLDTQAATMSDSTVTVTPTGDLSRFVNPGDKEVRARVTFIPNGQIVFSAWTASLGLTDWTIQ